MNNPNMELCIYRATNSIEETPGCWWNTSFDFCQEFAALNNLGFIYTATIVVDAELFMRACHSKNKRYYYDPVTEVTEDTVKDCAAATETTWNFLPEHLDSIQILGMYNVHTKRQIPTCMYTK